MLFRMPLAPGIRGGGRFWFSQRPTKRSIPRDSSDAGGVHSSAGMTASAGKTKQTLKTLRETKLPLANARVSGASLSRDDLSLGAPTSLQALTCTQSRLQVASRIKFWKAQMTCFGHSRAGRCCGSGAVPAAAGADWHLPSLAAAASPLTRFVCSDAPAASAERGVDPTCGRAGCRSSCWRRRCARRRCMGRPTAGCCRRANMGPSRVPTTGL